MLKFGVPLHLSCRPDEVHPTLRRIISTCAGAGLEPVYNAVTLNQHTVQRDVLKLKYVIQTKTDFDLSLFSVESAILALRDFIRELREPLIINPKPFFNIYKILYGLDRSGAPIKLTKSQMR